LTRGPNIARVTKGASRSGIDRPPRFRRYIRVSPIADPMRNECDHPPAQRELTDLARAVVGDGLDYRGHLALTERSARASSPATPRAAALTAWPAAILSN
jgi:hypothetical protein